MNFGEIKNPAHCLIPSNLSSINRVFSGHFRAAEQDKKHYTAMASPHEVIIANIFGR